MKIGPRGTPAFRWNPTQWSVGPFLLWLSGMAALLLVRIIVRNSAYPQTVGFLVPLVDTAYNDAGLHPDDIDTGVVILTGEALRRENAERIASVLSEKCSTPKRSQSKFCGAIFIVCLAGLAESIPSGPSRQVDLR